MPAAAGRARLVKQFAALEWRLGRAIRAGVTASLGSTESPVSAAIRAITPHQREVLMVLAREGQLAMGELARRLGITPSGATELVDRLVERGWVERLAGAADRRAVVVRLTGPAQELAEQVRGAVTAGTQTLLAALDDRELATLVALLERVVGAAGAAPTPIPGAADSRQICDGESR